MTKKMFQDNEVKTIKDLRLLNLQNAIDAYEMEDTKKCMRWLDIIMMTVEIDSAIKKEMYNAADEAYAYSLNMEQEIKKMFPQDDKPEIFHETDMLPGARMLLDKMTDILISHELINV